MNIIKKILIAIGFLLLLKFAGSGTYIAANPHHECIDKTHKSCDSVCECDGMGCTN